MHLLTSSRQVRRRVRTDDDGSPSSTEDSPLLKQLSLDAELGMASAEQDDSAAAPLQGGAGHGPRPALPADRRLNKRKSFIPGLDRAPDGVPNSDQTDAAINFFSSERTPAALIAGSALSILYAFPLTDSDAPDIAVSKRLYLVLANLAFLHALIAVFAASLAITRLLSRGHDAMARDPLVMMLRETPIYFMGVRSHFLTSLLCFVGALTLRMWTEYSKKTPRFARALLCLSGSSLAFMIALYNMTLVHFSSFPHLWYCYLRCLFERCINRKPKVGKPAGVMAIAAIVLAVVSAVDLFAIARAYFVEGVANVLSSDDGPAPAARRK